MWTRVLLFGLTLLLLGTTTLSQDPTVAGAEDTAATEAQGDADLVVAAGAVTDSAPPPGDVGGAAPVTGGSETVTEANQDEAAATPGGSDVVTGGQPEVVTGGQPEVATVGQFEVVTDGQVGGDAATTASSVVGGDPGDLGKEQPGGGDIGDNGEEDATTQAPGRALDSTGETGAAVSSTVQPGTAVPPGAHEGTAVAGTSGPSVGDQGTQAAPEATTTVSIITTTLRIWAADDPCSTFKMLNEELRHYSYPAGAQPLSDDELAEGWYGFNFKNQSAIVTPECIKEKYCSTLMPYHLQDKVDPAIGETADTQMCGPGTVAGETGCCLMPVPIKVRNCQTRYIYFLSKVDLKSASVCIRLPDEVVPDSYLAKPPSREATTPATTTPRPTLPNVHHSKLTGNDGIVTIEYEYPQKLKDSNFLIEDFDAKFRKMIADALNNMTFDSAPTVIVKESDPIEGVKDTLPTQVEPFVGDVDTDADMRGPEETRRRRETGKHVYQDDDVTYVGPTPRESGETLQVAIYVEDPENGKVPAEHMMQALNNLEQSGQLGSKVNLTMITYYEGLPQDIQPVDRSPDTGMWDRHRELLIALIVLTSICLLIILIGLCCLKCRKSRGSWTRDDDKVAMEAGHPKKRPPMMMENPLPDSEIMRDEAPMTERDNPAMTSNGGGGHLSKKDDDNGWVVPIDELSKAEKEKPEVEDTKL